MDIVWGWIVDAINWVLSQIFFFLPVSPFKDYLEGISDLEVLQYVNWFIPIGEFISILVLWLGAIGVFYTYQIVLRWIKAIDD